MILGVLSGLFSLSAQAQSKFILGADISFLQQIEQYGGVFSEQGISRDLPQLLSANGFNTVRLRLWHTPAEGWNDLERTQSMARRIRDAELDLFLDIHYSDTWADPGNQTKPVMWEGLSFSSLKDSVYMYTYRVIDALVTQGTPPRQVQLGNEIIQGLLWNEGRVGGSFDTPDQWGQLTQLLQAAIDGVKDGSGEESIDVVIHIDRGGDVEGATWFFDHLLDNGLDFDTIGLSYYPWWHGTFEDLEQTLNTLTVRYSKPIVIVETAYPWTLGWFDDTNNIVGLPEQLLPEYEATPEGQSRYIAELLQCVRNASLGLGAGVIYWAPEYISVLGVGSPWENLALFDEHGDALIGLQAFKEASSVGVEQTLVMDNALNVQVYPNPFQTAFVLEYTLSSSSAVTISVYDVLGREIYTALNSEQEYAGA